MHYEILPSGNLRIYADEDDRRFLRELREDYPDDPVRVEYDALESLIVNSELDWIPEGATADITSAPMLGIVGLSEGRGFRRHELPSDRFGEVLVGHDAGGEYWEPVVARWAFMPYMLRSFVDDLIDTGHATFEGGFASA